MLPNHAPLKVAETFRMLEALAPGRVDLGLGRAPGTDGRTAYALRRSASEAEGDFEAQLAELMAYGGLSSFPAHHPFASIVAAPDDQPLPPLWILSSSGHGAGVAAEVGTGLAFASHINPDLTLAAQAIRHYRATFQPSTPLSAPQVIVAQSVVLAESDEAAERLAKSLELMFLRLLRGESAPFATLEEAERYPYTAAEQQQLQHMRYAGRFVVGGPERVKARLDEVLRLTSADELMVGCLLIDLSDRLHAYTRLAELYPQARQKAPDLTNA